MRILIISQYFWPESFIINQLATTLVEQGHKITVLTGKPNYPDGDIFDGYTQQGVIKERYKGVDIIRVPLKPRGKGGGKALLINYFSFIMSGLFKFPTLVKGKKFDIIFVFAPSPITSAIPAILLKYIKRTHLAIWVQDLWPESLSATGFIKNKIILKMVQYLVKVIYYYADTLLVQSQAFIEPVTQLSNKGKVVYFPNIVNDDERKGLPSKPNNVPNELLEQLDRDFCVLFAGNIGQAQSIETLIAAAEKVKHIPEIKLIIVGSGSALAWAKHEVEQKQLHNVIFTGRYPAEVMPFLFAKAKGLLVTLRDQDIFSYTVPSKVQAYMCAGRPIIAGINGEAARVVAEAKSGLVCPAEDSTGLANKISQLFYMSESEREIMGKNGRRYFLAHFELKQKCKELVGIFQQNIDLKRQKSE